MGIGISPRNPTVKKGGSVNFTVSANGYLAADYNVIFKVAGTKLIDKWFMGPGSHEYSATASFSDVGVYATVATLTRYPDMVLEKTSGSVTVTDGVPPPPPPPEYTLNISREGAGTTDPPPGIYIFEEGSRVTVTAIPDAGYYFDYWLLDAVKKTENPITVTMTKNIDLRASFTETPPTPPPPPPPMSLIGLLLFGALIVGAIMMSKR